MKLQVAIDRVDLHSAKELIECLKEEADIIEIGTSLIKEFGIKEFFSLTKKACLLGDIKTCDEGAYEFILGFETGFQYLTVMGYSSKATLDICYEITEKYKRNMMIDLLECDNQKIKEISNYDNAIYCLHTSVDAGKTKNPIDQIRQFKKQFSNIKRIAIAGGIQREHLHDLNKEGIEIVIMGSAITKSTNVKKACHTCKEEL